MAVVAVSRFLPAAQLHVAPLNLYKRLYSSFLTVYTEKVTRCR